MYASSRSGAATVQSPLAPKAVRGESPSAHCRIWNIRQRRDGFLNRTERLLPTPPALAPPAELPLSLVISFKIAALSSRRTYDSKLRKHSSEVAAVEPDLPRVEGAKSCRGTLGSTTARLSRSTSMAEDTASAVICSGEQ